MTLRLISGENVFIYRTSGQHQWCLSLPFLWLVIQTPTKYDVFSLFIIPLLNMVIVLFRPVCVHEACWHWRIMWSSLLTVSWPLVFVFDYCSPTQFTGMLFTANEDPKMNTFYIPVSDTLCIVKLWISQWVFIQLTCFFWVQEHTWDVVSGNCCHEDWCMMCLQSCFGSSHWSVCAWQLCNHRNEYRTYPYKHLR